MPLEELVQFLEQYSSNCLLKKPQKYKYIITLHTANDEGLKYCYH